MFEAQVRATPEALAVVGEEGRLDYAALNERAEAVARGLRGLGVGVGTRVGVCLPRSHELVVGVLGILKAGGAYVPLDPTYPASRLQYMTEDAGLALVLVAESMPIGVLSMAVRSISVSAVAAMPGPAEWSRSGPRALAYVIYTSGSTGHPKGVLISHGAIANHMAWMCHRFGFCAQDRVLLKTSLSSDASVWELFGPLWVGGTLVVGGAEVQADTVRIAAAIRQHAVTIVQMVPSLLNAILAENLLASCPSLRLVFAGGETLSSAAADTFHAQCGAELHNLYGPTEVSVDATSWQCAPGTPDPLPIGRPISNIEAWVLDTESELLPEGIPGELYLGGAGLAEGYLNRSELTAEKFVPHPFKPGARLYRTGDRARWRPDGNLEFLGRMDAQVKLRGYRIEPGEIEAALLAEGAVQAAVILREDREGDPRLVAYVVECAAEDAGLKAALRQRLPEYMVPSAIVRLPGIPRTPNGKLDRKSLPVPGPAHTGVQAQAPETETEQALSLVWREILGVEQPGRSDDFFALGGHSLLVIRLLARLRASWEIDLTPRDAFEHATLAAQAALIDARRSAHSPDRRAQPLPRDPALPALASSAQQRLWFIERWMPGLPRYHIAEAWQLTGALDERALHAALLMLMQRHESLRTAFREQDDALLLEISAEPALPFSVEDLAHELPHERERRLDEGILRAFSEPFDLRAGPLWRARLWRCGSDTHVFVFVIHHLVSDGWSQAILHSELAHAYAAAKRGNRPDWPTLPLTYADYAAWMAAGDGGIKAAELAWWVHQLSDLPRLELPWDRAWPALPTFAGRMFRFALPTGLAARVRQSAQAHGATPFMVLLTVFKLLLARYSGSEDVVVGTPVAGRDHAALQGVVGMFVNTLVLRTRLPAGNTFNNALESVRGTVLEAQVHGDTPFDALVRALNPPREVGRNPLFQVMFSCQRADDRGLVLDGLEATSADIPRSLAKFDLSLSLLEDAGGIHGAFEFSREIFDDHTVARMAGHYLRWLEALLEAPDQTLDELALGTSAERAELMAWSIPEAPALPPLGVAALFELQARATPEAIALTAGDVSFTYAMLEREAEGLASLLLKAGMGHEARIGICASRSVDLVVGILAILKAGGAWVPLDPAWPDARLQQILTLAECPLVLTQSDKRARLEALHHRVLACDARPAAPAGNHSSLVRTARDDSLAYVMFTSGSTGTPKGVLIEQRSIVRLVRAQTYARFAPDEVFLLLSPIAFDASTFEMWGALLNGARLVIHAEERVSTAGLETVIRTQGVTTLWLTAALFNAVIDERPGALQGLRQLLTGGEALSPPHVQRALAALLGVRLINGYGPTESTTFACCHTLEPAMMDGVSPVPIGRPIAHTEAFVLDFRGQLAPVGIEGDLCLGGIGLARGYLGDPVQTAERFVNHPLRAGARVYRTGDRARWRPDGTLEFRGRRDDQVKLRGHRIEPGEISHVIASLPGVQQAAVLVQTLEIGEPALVAHVVANGVELDALRAALRMRLPEYMQPSRWQILEALPMTANGKLDRTRLVLPPAERARVTAEGKAARADMVERHLLGLWQNFLQRNDIDLDAAFLELGGHSLLAVRIIDAIENAFGVRLPLDILWLQGGSIRSVAQRLRDRRQLAPWPVLVPLRPGGASPPLFCVHTIGGNLFHYFPLARALPQSVPIYGLQARGLEGLEKPRSAIPAIAADCVAALKQAWPLGPCRIIGYSSGGVVAWEIARQLAASGRDVELLGLVDTYAPGVFRRPVDRSSAAPRKRQLEHQSVFIRALHGLCRRLGLAPPGGFPNVAAAHWWAHAAYIPDAYNGPVDLFVTEVSQREASDPHLGWARLARGQFSSHLLPGDHAQIVKAPNVALLSAQLADRLGFPASP
jgi:amino acid adenylation domain-containing protein